MALLNNLVEFFRDFTLAVVLIGTKVFLFLADILEFIFELRVLYFQVLGTSLTTQAL